MKIIINGELPTTNEIVAASKKHYMTYANMKKTYTQLVALQAGKLPKIKKADFKITWYCKNMRKDKDNIMGGQKFIFDGLVQAEVIENDGWKQIGNVSHLFEVDSKNPRVEIQIEEVKI